MILYDDNAHRYYDTKGDFISCTTLIKKYVNPFNADAMSKHVAKKRGGTPGQWKRIWKEHGEYAADRGNQLHEIKETVEGAKFRTQWDGKDADVHNQWLLLQRANDWNYLKNLPDGMYMELMLWHGGYRVAGRADKCLIETVGQDRYMHIKDHKTNEKPLNKESYQYPDGKFKMMLPPVQHVMDCKFWEYSMQLSLYMLMAEFMGFKPGDMEILHYGLTPFEQAQGITLTLEDMLKREPTVHPVRYMKKEVISICTHYLKTLNRA